MPEEEEEEEEERWILCGTRKMNCVACEPVSVALSALNLAIQFHGWVSFFILRYYKLQLTPSKKTYYEYTGLWPIYGILSMNSWFWSAVFHSRDVELTEKLDCSSAVALGFSPILAILRAFNMRDEAARVMVSAPIIAFVTTHILYLNFYNLDYINGKFMKLLLGRGEYDGEDERKGWT
ncbi:uncharacterized protein [Populus alba]|uniref:uncharacterized protein n=1 Tax=Populus alba TaxID=43335 RepID=UPI003CC7771F